MPSALQSAIRALARHPREGGDPVRLFYSLGSRLRGNDGKFAGMTEKMEQRK